MKNYQSMKILAIIVTYGQRAHLLTRVIESTIREGIDKIIIVDNDSSPESKKKINVLSKKHFPKIHLVLNTANTGSSGGFSTGLKTAQKYPDYNYYWLLDDDNMPEINSLEKLKLAYSYLGNVSKNILVSSRASSRKQDMESIVQGKNKKYISNNICGWTFSQKIKTLFYTIKSYRVNFFLLRNEIAPYGGLFFNKSVIKKVGYPKKQLFVYADDHDWTYRMTKKGFSIVLCSESKIKDIDNSKVSISKDKIYYQVRNHTWLSKRFITNKFFFYCNCIVYCFLYLILKHFYHCAFNSKYKNIPYFITIKAFYDGINLKID
ncbi:MAG TPA: glycosyltransferase [Spirochaetota bacterium]|nr:glycosyltransferase [Spirochaetota bacterium]HOR45945.1 glycosyltransferase [Spirochaetota bacterium]HPK57575.1 glycosyltransferase [Spirochaetota bacterium]HQE60174.1 glycosyltransferase [Spirochaetota bacterium]